MKKFVYANRKSGNPSLREKAAFNMRLVYDLLTNILDEVQVENGIAEEGSFGVIKTETGWQAIIKKPVKVSEEGDTSSYRLQLLPLRMPLLGYTDAIVDCFATERRSDAVGVICDDGRIRLVVKGDDKYFISGWKQK